MDTENNLEQGGDPNKMTRRSSAPIAAAPQPLDSLRHGQKISDSYVHQHQRLHFQQRETSKTGDQTPGEAETCGDEDYDYEEELSSTENDDEDEDEENEVEEDEEASQHSLCEYFHHNTQLAAAMRLQNDNLFVPSTTASRENFLAASSQMSNGVAGASAKSQHSRRLEGHQEHFASSALGFHASGRDDLIQQGLFSTATAASCGGLGINRKRAFSFAASTSDSGANSTASVTPQHPLASVRRPSIAKESSAAAEDTPNGSGGAQQAAGEKRAATKICRVCGDKAFSYNFNVITCESCKAFFRRNANKEKEIRCPFNEQCDINIVSRRFCQRCRLQKCFRVGMKKEWIMSDEQRLEKKIRIQFNRQRRLAERQGKNSIAGVAHGDEGGLEHLEDNRDHAAGASATVNNLTATTAQMQPPIEAMLEGALPTESSQLHTTQQQQHQSLIQQVLGSAEPLTLPVSAMSAQAPALSSTQQQSQLSQAAAVQLGAALVESAAAVQQQQLAVAAGLLSAQQQLAAELAATGNNTGSSAMTTTTTFCSPSTNLGGGVYQQQAGITPLQAETTAAAHHSVSSTGVLASPTNGVVASGIAPSIIEVVAASQIAAVQQAAAASAFTQQQQQSVAGAPQHTSPSALTTSQGIEAAAAALVSAANCGDEAAMSVVAATNAVVQHQLNAAQQVVQQLVVEELVAQQQQAAVQQQIQQQQLAAAVAVAAASTILQQQKQQQQEALAVSGTPMETNAGQPAVPIASQMALNPLGVGLESSSVLAPPASTQQPQQELVAVPKDVLIKLVEQKIESDHAQQQQIHMEMELKQQQQAHAVPPLKCQCRCQCGRYPPEELIIDRVMTDLLLADHQPASSVRTAGCTGNPCQQQQSTTCPSTIGIAAPPRVSGGVSSGDAMDTSAPPPLREGRNE